MAEFLDTLIQNLPNLPIPPQAAAKLLALAIQMKELGPKGDQMAELISPSDGDERQQLQGMQAQLQQQQAAMTEMQSQFQRLLVEKQGKVIDNEYAIKLKEMDIQAKAIARKQRIFNTFWLWDLLIGAICENYSKYWKFELGTTCPNGPIVLQ